METLYCGELLNQPATTASDSTVTPNISEKKQPPNSLTWEEAKNEAAKASNIENWDQFIEQIVNNPVKALRIEGGYLFAAELYASSRVRALEGEIKSLEKLSNTKQAEINLDALSCAVADADEEIEQRLKKEQNDELLNALRKAASLEEENKRLQEKLNRVKAEAINQLNLLTNILAKKHDELIQPDYKAALRVELERLADPQNYNGAHDFDDGMIHAYKQVIELLDKITPKEK